MADVTSPFSQGPERMGWESHFSSNPRGGVCPKGTRQGRSQVTLPDEINSNSSQLNKLARPAYGREPVVEGMG
jgi:hypothetical protein